MNHPSECLIGQRKFFMCQKVRQMAKECTSRKVSARAFAMTKQEVEFYPSIVAGNVLIYNLEMMHCLIRDLLIPLALGLRSIS